MDVLIVGTGEYTTGYVPTSEGAAPDKKMGVVGLVMFDLRRRGFVKRVVYAGTDGTKFPSIREHLRKTICGTYADMDTSFDSFPADTAKDPQAYKLAIASMKPGDHVLIYTPDDTHFAIAECALKAKLHVLLTKPGVKILEHHRALVDLAKANSVKLCLDMHKRHDPIYRDACGRVPSLGPFSYFYSYMSQPKKQLHTFGKWAGKSSDISYYLNSHHVDVLCWMVGSRATPLTVCASAARGVADGLGMETEDTITLLVQWRNNEGGAMATSTHSASWAAPKSDVHTQQRFHYVGQLGEVTADQAHRGYSMSTDADSLVSLNPLYMKYSPSVSGHFDGQRGYGYTILEAFVVGGMDLVLMSERASFLVTAILEAGRVSLDAGGNVVHVQYGEDGKNELPTGLKSL
jgi:D-galacturonate reductase